MKKTIETKRAFTFIELLVVVLIIGILAAVAVPQYQKAVAKSRFATLKNLTASIAQAQEIYYLAEGKYTDNFEALDIDMPGGRLNTSASKKYDYDWGYCRLNIDTSVNRVECDNNLINMEYRIYLMHSPAQAGYRHCVVRQPSVKKWRGTICENETQNTNGIEATGQIYWIYEGAF